MERPSISVVMASMNEEGAIAGMIESIRRNSDGFDTEIVLVDSSRDKTPEIAASMGARVIKQEPRGHGTALKAAIAAAKNDLVITADCDNTYPMEFIPELARLAAEEKYDLVSCCRLHAGLGDEMPLTNKFGNWLFAFLVRVLYGYPVHDVTTGMFCMNRKFRETVKLENNYSLPCEIIVRAFRAGLRHKEVNIPYRIRIGEVTLNKWRSGKAYLRCIFNYRFDLGLDPGMM